MPTLYNNYKWKQYKSSLLKAVALLNQASYLYHVQEGNSALCGYGYSTTGSFKDSTDCKALYNFYTKTFKIAKLCDSNAYSNGCIPHYLGMDDIKENVGGCQEFTRSKILNGKAFITDDGTIYMPYGDYSAYPLMAIDVNGFKGPNKWGHDVFVVEGYIKTIYTDPVYKNPDRCEMIEKGGISTKELLYKK